jgi:6-phosphofructokinase 2
MRWVGSMGDLGQAFQMRPIVTLTFNAAVDSFMVAPAIVPGHKIRTSRGRLDPGGGGLNVARAIARLGGPVTPIYLAGGATGQLLEALLHRDGLSGIAVSIRGETRLCHTVRETSTGQEYRFIAEGPTVGPEEMETAISVLNKLDFDWLVASGSLPPGVPPDAYTRLTRVAVAHDARFVLDSSGDALRAALAGGGIDVVKPSLRELEDLAGKPLRSMEEQASAAEVFLHSGAARLVALTLGERGAILVEQGRILHVAAPAVAACSTVGAGDCFVAGLTLGLAQGFSNEDALMLAVASGVASVLREVTQLCEIADVSRIRQELSLTPLLQQHRP